MIIIKSNMVGMIDMVGKIVFNKVRHGGNNRNLKQSQIIVFHLAVESNIIYEWTYVTIGIGQYTW